MTVTGGFQPDDAPYSKNDRAAEVCGPRLPSGAAVIPIDQPCELGFHCPVCEYPQHIDGTFDDRLDWSEYKFFLWCAVCDRDYPTVLCAPLDQADPYDGAIDLFLRAIAEARTMGPVTSLPSRS